MWHLYAQTAFDLVRERQLDAERRYLLRYADEYTPPRPNPLRRAIGGSLASVGRATQRLGDATIALGGRVEGPVTQA